MPHEPVIIDSASCYLRSSQKYWTKQVEKNKKKNVFKRRATRIVESSISKPTESGDAVLERIQYLLEKGFGVKRSATQCEIHKEFIEASLPKIYQAVWQKSAPSILKQFNVKQLIQEVLVIMPRRRGKSYSAAMFAAACLLCIPECSCIIFSTGERTAKLLMTVITDLMEKAFSLGSLKKDDFHFETNNKECIVFYGPDGTKRSLMCLPGSVRVSIYFFQENAEEQFIICNGFSFVIENCLRKFSSSAVNK